MRVAVVGLGKIGLPLAVQYASHGADVSGVDLNPDTVCLVNEGVEPFPGEARLGVALRDVVAAGRLIATESYADAIPGADVVVVVVPLFVDAEDQPDYAWMDSATTSVAETIAPGTLVCYETTLPVGTTRHRWKPLIESISGLVEGEDFFLAFSPERVLTGRVFADLRRYPKLIGGLTAEGARRARDFYETVLDFDERPDLPRANGVWDLGSAEAAEMAKLAETTYRDVNIGLANQFGQFAERHGIDVYAVIEACNSQVFSHIHQPGIAVGGHCIPVYPRLDLSVDPDATIVREARRVNAAMPERVVARAADLLGDLSGLRVVVLGATYRGGVKETAFSGVFPLVAALRARGAHAFVHDEMMDDDDLKSIGFVPYHLGEPVDLAIVQTDHGGYRTLSARDLPGVRLLIDGRRVTDPALWAGVARVVIGEGQVPAL